MTPLIGALLTTLVLCGLRLDMARVIGLGDAEALYVAYGLHPQPAYLDHPGLIGWIARALGPLTTPTGIHVVVALASTSLPWAGVLAARACGATRALALRTYFPLALIPELSIRSFAFAPHLLMAFCWLFSLGCAGWALRQPAAKFGALIGSLGAGTGAALACLSKNTGWLLALSLLCACLGRSQAARWRTLAPWAGCAVFAILTAPLIEWWLTRGSSVQLVPEVSWQTAASAVVQPFLTATPPFLYAGGVVLRELFGPNRRSPVDRLFRLSIVVPIVPLALLAIFTTGDAEWLTPALLTLSVHSARAPAVARGLMKTCIGAGAAIALLGWCWLRTDLPWHTGQLLGGYEPWLDASNDFYAWGPGRELLEGAVTSARERTGQNPVVVGPHWSVCAQADVALAGRVHVGCNTVELDDYDNWSHPARWSDAATVLFVTDSRFHATPPETFQGRPPVAVHGVSVDRFERSVRHISVTEFDRESATAMGSTPAPRGPPAR